MGEPEAEADAEAGVAHYGHAYGAYPYGLRTYGAYPYAFGGYYGHGLVAGASSFQHASTPAAAYGISQIHKRSADAEYYGGYYGHAGYGRGCGYGGYGRGYGYGAGYYGRGYGYGYGRGYGYGYGR